MAVLANSDSSFSSYNWSSASDDITAARALTDSTLNGTDTNQATAVSPTTSTSPVAGIKPLGPVGGVRG